MIKSAEILHKYSLFDGIEPPQVDYVLSLMEEEEYDAGSDIIIESTHNCKIYFILNGRVAAIKNEVILEELDEGAFFGEMEVLDINPSAATIKALAPTNVLVLTIDALGEIYESDLKTYCFIITNLARDLSRKLRRLDVIVAKESPPMEWN